MLPRIIEPSGDDWIVRVWCRKDGKEETKWVGVSGAGTNEKRALWAARVHINRRRMVIQGTAYEIIDMEAAHMWEWKARALAEKAPEHFARDVAGWQKAESPCPVR